MLPEPTEPSTPTDPPGAAPLVPRRRRRLLPALVVVSVLGLAGGLLVRRLGPRPVPPPVVPVYTPGQAAQAQAHLDELRDHLARPSSPPLMHLELSQQDLNAYLATNPGAKGFLSRQGVKAIQINFEPPCSLRIRAAVVYRGRPANVQLTGRLQPDRRTILGFVATGAQVGRLPLPPDAVTAQANKLAAQFTRRLGRRLPFSVQTVQVVDNRLVLTGVRKPPITLHRAAPQ